MTRAEPLSALAVAATCMIIGGFALYQEAAVFSYGTQTNIMLYDKIAARDVRLGYSYYSQKRLMASCVFGMTSLQAQVRTPEQNQDFARSCLNLATQVTTSSPIDGLGWLVSAYAAAVLNDADALNSGLTYSWNATKKEQWLAALRVDLAEDNYALLNDETRNNNLKDLSVLVLSNSGIASIARRYWDHPEFRGRITEVVSALPGQAQMKFLGAVRRAGATSASTP